MILVNTSVKNALWLAQGKSEKGKLKLHTDGATTENLGAYRGSESLRTIWVIV